MQRSAIVDSHTVSDGTAACRKTQKLERVPFARSLTGYIWSRRIRSDRFEDKQSNW